MTGQCPECGNDDIALEGGCPLCWKCGWSKCS